MLWNDFEGDYGKMLFKNQGRNVQPKKKIPMNTWCKFLSHCVQVIRNLFIIVFNVKNVEKKFAILIYLKNTRKLFME